VHKYLFYFILENLDTVRRIPVGRFWGVSLLITPFTWLGPFLFFGLNFLLNLFNASLSLTDRLYQAFIFALVVEITTALHAWGHILSGKLVHSPMDELLITALRDVNLYHGDQAQVPGHVHLGRSLGGPVFNLLVAAACYGLIPFLNPGFGLAFTASLASTNLFFGLGGFLPLPSVDGEVIWREILRPIRSRLQKKG
jgi:Zn-dependent protease